MLNVAPFMKRNRTFVWKWVHRFGSILRDRYSDRLPEVVVIDETLLKVGDMHLWFWFVIDPEKQRMYRGLPSVAITDGGSWYLVLKRYGIEHRIVSGGIRNYIERLIETGQ